MIQDEVLGELTLDKTMMPLRVRSSGAERMYAFLWRSMLSKPSWTRARNAAKRLVTDQETWDKAMRDFAAKNLTGLANNWLSQDEESARDPKQPPSRRRVCPAHPAHRGFRFSRRPFTAYYNDDDMFWGHAVEVSGSLKKGIT